MILAQQIDNIVKQYPTLAQYVQVYDMEDYINVVFLTEKSKTTASMITFRADEDTKAITNIKLNAVGNTLENMNTFYFMN